MTGQLEIADGGVGTAQIANGAVDSAQLAANVHGLFAAVSGIQVLVAAPANPVAGSAYFKVADGTLNIYTGAAWVKTVLE